MKNKISIDASVLAVHIYRPKGDYLKRLHIKSYCPE